MSSHGNRRDTITRNSVWARDIIVTWLFNVTWPSACLSRVQSTRALCRELASAGRLPKFMLHYPFCLLLLLQALDSQFTMMPVVSDFTKPPRSAIFSDDYDDHEHPNSRWNLRFDELFDKMTPESTVSATKILSLYLYLWSVFSVAPWFVSKSINLLFSLAFQV